MHYVTIISLTIYISPRDSPTTYSILKARDRSGKVGFQVQE